MTSTPLDRLLAAAQEYNASDLHIIAGVPPAFRVNGEIILAETDVLAEADADEMAFQLLNEAQREKFEREWEMCISMRHPAVGRVRVTFYKRNGHPELSFRFCGERGATREERGQPAKIDEMARKPNGLLLITGPTRAGKNTTLK
jgi:twitching motility protein PilT